MEIQDYRVDFACKIGETFFVDIKNIKTNKIYEFYQNENAENKKIFIFNGKNLSIKEQEECKFIPFNEYKIEWNNCGEILIFNEIN